MILLIIALGEKIGDLGSMQFKMKVARHGQGIVYIEVDAPSKEDALHQATGRGLTVLSLKSNEPLIKLPKLFSRFSLSLNLVKSY